MKFLIRGMWDKVSDLEERLNSAGILTQTKRIPVYARGLSDLDEFKLFVVIESQYDDAIKLMNNPNHIPDVKIDENHLKQTVKEVNEKLFYSLCKYLSYFLIVIAIYNVILATT